VEESAVPKKSRDGTTMSRKQAALQRYDSIRDLLLNHIKVAELLILPKLNVRTLGQWLDAKERKEDTLNNQQGLNLPQPPLTGHCLPSKELRETRGPAPPTPHVSIEAPNLAGEARLGLPGKRFTVAIEVQTQMDMPDHMSTDFTPRSTEWYRREA
jgi:hypothetical protein